MNKETYDKRRVLGFPLITEEGMIESLVNRLIEALYKPDEDLLFLRDSERCEAFGVKAEPVNWGNLKVMEVAKGSECWMVTIDEASPGACPTFCAYIEKYMAAWGWPIVIKTEW